MAKPGRMREIAKEHEGESLEQVVVRKLNEHGSIERAASDLGISFRNLYQWCKDNGIQKHVVWSRPEVQHEQA